LKAKHVKEGSAEEATRFQMLRDLEAPMRALIVSALTALRTSGILHDAMKQSLIYDIFTLPAFNVLQLAQT
jgi:hypothetical protein